MSFIVQFDFDFVCVYIYACITTEVNFGNKLVYLVNSPKTQACSVPLCVKVKTNQIEGFMKPRTFSLEVSVSVSNDS